MKLTAKVKLQPTDGHRESLIATMRTFNEACNYVSGYAWDNKGFSRFPLQKATYYDVKERFGLTAQVAIHVSRKVADSYKKDKRTKREFKSLGAVAYDDRILKWYVDRQEISIWSVDGRLKELSFVCGERQKELLQGRQGESDLCYIDGEFYLFATCDIDEPDPRDVKEFLGVDMGIVNIATTSDGRKFSGDKLEEKRAWYAERKAILQSVGTLSAKRRLRKLSGKQARFQKITNHEIAKEIVGIAKDTGRGIALENLQGIRDRTTVKKQQRSRHHNWPFFQLAEFIKYKAQLHGIPVSLVDPRNTSKTCSECGHCERSNRKSQDRFACNACGFVAHADVNAAINIAAKAYL